MSFAAKTRRVFGVGPSSHSSGSSTAVAGTQATNGLFSGTDAHRFTTGQHGFGPDSFEEDVPLFGLDNVSTTAQARLPRHINVSANPD